MEMTTNSVWKTEMELEREFYQLKNELDAAYGTDLQVIVEDNQDALIIGFSTHIDGFLFEITTRYHVCHGQNDTIYEKAQPYWYASRSGRPIGSHLMESADEAMRAVICSLEALAELDIEEEKPVLEQDHSSFSVRYTYRQPSDNDEISKVFPIEDVELGLAAPFRKNLEDNGYELVERTKENDPFDSLLNALFELKDMLEDEKEKANQKRYQHTANQWFDNGLHNGYKNSLDLVNDIIKKFA